MEANAQLVSGHPRHQQLRRRTSYQLCEEGQPFPSWRERAPLREKGAECSPCMQASPVMEQSDAELCHAPIRRHVGPQPRPSGLSYHVRGNGRRLLPFASADPPGCSMATPSILPEWPSSRVFQTPISLANCSFLAVHLHRESGVQKKATRSNLRLDVTKCLSPPPPPFFLTDLITVPEMLGIHTQRQTLRLRHRYNSKSSSQRACSRGKDVACQPGPLSCYCNQ